MLKRVCTICARGGSKGVENKNIRLLNGVPLIMYSIKQAQQSGIFDYIAVSSDSDHILNVARNAGVDLIIKRPDDLASDTAGKLPAIQHAAEEAERVSSMRFDTFVDIDATSPLRYPNDIVGAVKLMEDNKVSNVITGCKSHRSPYFNLVEKDSNGFVTLSKKLSQNIVRRQDSPECFDMNASIYVWQRDALLNECKVFYKDTLLFEMPRNRSLDIDEPLDFDIVEMIIRKREEI